MIKMSKVFVVFLFFLGLVGLVFAQSLSDDPFDANLPVYIEPEEIEEFLPLEEEVVEEVSSPPTVTIQGILWGTTSPRAIIDGSVYKKGDQVKNQGGELVGIEKNNVVILYKGKNYTLGTKSVIPVVPQTENIKEVE